MSVLEHDELIHLARLLGHHVSSYGNNSKLERIGDKLMGYAERMQEPTDPLKLEPITSGFYPGRVMFREVV
jgi:hypothetical protein